MVKNLHNVIREKLKRLHARVAKITSKINAERKERDSLFVGQYLNEKEILLKEIKQLQSNLQELDESKIIGRTYVVCINNSKREFQIVSPKLANPQKGLISVESPLAKALIETKEGDTVNVRVPAGIFKYKILSLL